eukprot:4749747-Pyramimonas_sp.AAC.1
MSWPLTVAACTRRWKRRCGGATARSPPGCPPTSPCTTRPSAPARERAASTWRSTRSAPCG